ncbi:SusC/RagA family TonB-linked outer membrane protein [Myroides marinus]|uniref:SusC/RagA family TonB-linked outer membrane protein n=1 Tax=Myroides marinus TaxID=703342 RepID=UPI002575B1C6|nr:SusC/RagA family TonB-linked outer membrane protein [Myroides marinus]MDM1348061.1 SusC/RagA family TonB-linked outer membrane protein [Myroides marinus]MDM1351621.1 SusC/RagA family TonB-linked outer membrane protein [Myroides marinus]MDM1355215.1 SusC/RagA family TonB-linked outer membrane protein [Myroides marinus]MDM1358828.1 SusC/RagA family TonB-linked outer membrane protein [Myroides marinus]MDM1361317.1 SusC/RagA family TonB-linked outer membrane protein [Myroides marinus]
MKKLFLLFSLLTISLAFAQEKRVITGLVQDSTDKLGLPGASVIVETQTVSNATTQAGIVESTSIGTMTDFDGNFTLEVPQDTKSIRISFIGYESKLITLGAKGHYVVTLGTDADILNEVVITGYQTIEKRKLTSSVAQVSMAEINQNGVASVDQMLAGQVAGMAVVNQTGAPGAPAKIRIRGTASLSGAQDPLWVLDGMPLEGNDVPNFNDKDNIDQLQNFSIAGLNPDDIQDITILKDASATAIYGARAANGVILITTKKGKKGNMKVNFTANTFVNQRPDFNKLNLMNSDQKVDFELMLAGRSDIFNDRSNQGEVMRILNGTNELDTYRNGGFGALSSATQASINNLRKTNTDWGKEIFRPTFNKQYGLSLSGGSDVNDYYFSLGYFNEEGTTIGTGFERFNITLKDNYQVSDKLKVGVALFGTHSKKNNFVTDADAAINPINYSRNANPYLSPYNSDGSYMYDKDISGYEDRYVPFNFAEERANTSYELVNKSFKAVFDLEYQVLNDLKLTSQLGLQLDKSDTEKYLGKETYSTRKFREATRYYDRASKQFKYFLPDGGIIENFNDDMFQYNWKTQATYNAIFNDMHEVDVMAGMEIRKSDQTIIKSKGFGYDANTLTTKPIIFPEGSTETNEKKYEQYKKTVNENAYASFFATASYTYNRKYTVFGSVRADGSNLFGVDPKYRYVPLWAVSGSWDVTREGFMENLDFVSNLRLRASYGLQGNIDKTTSPFLLGEYSTSTILPGYPGQTIQVNSAPNGTLRWEKTTNTNLGFDLGLFNNRISIAVDAYNRKSTDLIGLRALPLETGFEWTNMNWAQVTNKGYEIAVTTRNISTPDFSWTTTFNFARNKSKVDKIQIFDSETLPSREGLPVNSVFHIKTAGFDEKGNLLFWKEGEKVTGKEFFKLSDPMADFMPGYMVESGLTTQEYRDLYSYAGDKDPKFTGGLINTVRIKNFDLTVSAAFNLKQTVQKTPTYNAAKVDPGRNYTTDLLDIWSPTNPNGSLPGLIADDNQGNYNTDNENWMLAKWFDGGDNGNSYKYLDIWTKEISYIRISSIRLGYTLPKDLLKRLNVDNIRFTVEGRNLFVFGTNYDGYFDPETYGNIYTQPIQKSFTLGLNVTF